MEAPPTRLPLSQTQLWFYITQSVHLNGSCITIQCKRTLQMRTAEVGSIEMTHASEGDVSLRCGCRCFFSGSRSLLNSTPMWTSTPISSATFRRISCSCRIPANRNHLQLTVTTTRISHHGDQNKLQSLPTHQSPHTITTTQTSHQ